MGGTMLLTLDVVKDDSAIESMSRPPMKELYGLQYGAFSCIFPPSYHTVLLSEI